MVVSLINTGRGKQVDIERSYQKQMAFGDLFSWFLLLSCVVEVMVTASRTTQRPERKTLPYRYVLMLIHRRLSS
jgi:hypothetical protein